MNLFSCRGGTSVVAPLLARLGRAFVDRLLAALDLASAPLRRPLARSVVSSAAVLIAVDVAGAAITFMPAPAGPLNVTVGSTVQVTFTVGGMAYTGSWKIDGTLPPGTTLGAMEGGASLTAPGTLDATAPAMDDGYGYMTGGNSQTTPQLTGTPTTAGTYTFTLQAFSAGGLQGTASDTFSYTVNVTAAPPPNVAPAITTQPQSRTASAGASVTLSGAASGTPSPALQWQKDGTPIAGATDASLVLTNVQTTAAGNYTLVASNNMGTATSNAALLTVTSAIASGPTFTLQPASAAIATGGSVVFDAAAGAASYQWQKNGVVIAGATDAMLMLSHVAATDAGTYSVVASTSAGSATSNPATLTVSSAGPAAVGRLTNLSVRTFSGTGDQVLNVGFSLGGAGTSGSTPLLLRVSGPALAAFGVGGTMADPMLTVQPLGSSTAVASNDDWNGDPNVTATSNAVGAFGLVDPASKDAATVASLGGGTYTVVAAGKNGGTGVVITEIYDATPAAGMTASTPRLVNVSARAQAGTGDNVLTVGFAVSGTTAATVLIRASGPALAPYGVTGVLADPLLQVFQLGGPKLYENDNWGGSEVIANAASAVGAFGITDPNSKDAALLVTLAPGVYTAQVKGADGGTGVCLVEVYAVP